MVLHHRKFEKLDRHLSQNIAKLVFLSTKCMLTRGSGKLYLKTIKSINTGILEKSSLCLYSKQTFQANSYCQEIVSKSIKLKFTYHYPLSSVVSNGCDLPQKANNSQLFYIYFRNRNKMKKIVTNPYILWRMPLCTA